MQRYQPPHARRQQAQTETRTQTSTTAAPVLVQSDSSTDRARKAGGPFRDSPSYGRVINGPSVTDPEQTRWDRNSPAVQGGAGSGPAQNQRGPPISSTSASASTVAPGAASDKYAPRPSRKDWSTPLNSSSTSSPSSSRHDARGNHLNIRGSASSYSYSRQGSDSVLASPASDIKPMRSRTPGLGLGTDTGQEQEDLQGKMRTREMEMMQSVSRSGGDGAEGDALKDWSTQERYREYIDERIAGHYKSFRTPRHVLPAKSSTEEIESLGSIVLLFRKLREGVVASGRIDNFAIEVFESSVQFAILAGNRPQLISSLSGLVPGLYQASDQRQTSQSSQSSSQAERTGETTTDLAENGLSSLSHDGNSDSNSNGKRKEETERRAGFTSLLLLYQLAVLGQKDFWATYFALTLSTPSTGSQVQASQARRRGMRRTRMSADDFGESEGGSEPSQQHGVVGSGSNVTLSSETDLTHSQSKLKAEHDNGDSSTRPFISEPTSNPSISFALTAARCTSQTTFNPLRYFALLSAPNPHPNPNPSPNFDQALSYERAILAWMKDDMRERAWQLLGRAYISCGTDWAGKMLGFSAVKGADELTDFVVDKGKKVELGFVKLR
ncbi:hypothetical protein IAT40_000749 [Kwoniella sp. CBS 6097]